jgi:hypothetical protein
MDSLPSLSELLGPSTLGGRVPALVLGVLLLGFGRSLYRAFVIAPGILAGAWLATAARGPLSLTPMTYAIAILVAAAAGAILCHVVERTAVRLLGMVLVGGLAWFAWPLVQGAPAPLWLLGAAAVVGAAAWPFVHEMLLLPASAVAGAFVTAWALGYDGRVEVIGGLALAGIVVQGVLGRSGGGGASRKKVKGKARGKGEDGDE